MNINTSELPLTLDTLRQEVIKQENDKIVTRKMNRACIISGVLLTLEVLMIATYKATPLHFLIIIFIGFAEIILLLFAVSGKLVKYYHKKLSTRKSNLSEKEIDKKAFDFMEDIQDKMNTELGTADKNLEVLQTENKQMHEAYYEIYLAYIKLTMELRPGHYSSMEGGD